MEPHSDDCACSECVSKLANEVANGVGIRGQIEMLVEIISDYDLPELMPVLKTLQWIRDNERMIRQRMWL